MPYAVLVKEIETLPQECFSEIADFVQKLKIKYSQISKASEYPQGYFNLFGSVTDESFTEPNELDFSLDTKRSMF